jgi:hypothetical protein
MIYFKTTNEVIIELYKYYRFLKEYKYSVLDEIHIINRNDINDVLRTVKHDEINTKANRMISNVKSYINIKEYNEYIMIINKLKEYYNFSTYLCFCDEYEYIFSKHYIRMLLYHIRSTLIHYYKIGTVCFH